MGVLRVLSVTMGRISTFRSYQIMLLFAAALAVVAFYYFGSEKQNFSSTTKRIKETQASHNTNRDDADLSIDIRSGHPESRTGAGDEPEGKPSRFHALMMFTKVDKSLNLLHKFQVAMRSVAKHGRFLEEEVLVLHYVSDAGSRELGEKMLPELLLDATFRYEVVFHDVGTLTEKLFPIVEAMQKHFSAGSGAYYSDAIFFLSVAMHRIMPKELKRIVQLDLDLKFRGNIRDLFQEFNHFPAEAVIGIAREMQPVYRPSVVSKMSVIWALLTLRKLQHASLIRGAGNCCSNRSDPSGRFTKALKPQDSRNQFEQTVLLHSLKP
ncbi:xyloside xylosyltransferase 1 isoform X2 [Onychostoma macrolepis]|uniref:xyloside xylosyltransferase 1 isoform X2 n=1 Tax=Onychostoma macrolepis TaxID=369639 RepID=UPI00272C04C6|nr:xyloside xylosyltransferase 1 isoform X2 [Onychostoma macrolepis]